MLPITSLAQEKSEIEQLIDQSASETPDIQIRAYKRLDELGPLAFEGKNALINGVKSEEKEIQLHALRALGKLGASDDQVIKALCEALEDTKAEVRLEAVRSIGRLGKSATASLPCLIQLLDSEDKGLLLGAIFALGQLGEVAKESVPKLIEVSKSKNDWLISSFVFEALSSMPGQDQLGMIQEALDSDDDSVHQSAFDTLVNSGDSWSIFLAYVERYRRNLAYIIGSMLLFLGGFFTARFVQK